MFEIFKKKKERDARRDLEEGSIVIRDHFKRTIPELEGADEILDDNLESILSAHRSEEKRRNYESKLMMAKHDAESNKRLLQCGLLLQGKIHPATTEDYKRWLRGFLAKGGKISHVYDYPMSQTISEWFVAFKDFEISPLYGASSVYIIVQSGVRFLGGNLGHSGLYFMDEYTQNGGFVPIYSDLKYSNNTEAIRLLE